MRKTFPSERLRYAREFKGEVGKRSIVMALDRPISMWEAAQNPRWRDYDMTLIVLDVDAEGKGEGQLAMEKARRLPSSSNISIYLLCPIRK